MTERKPDWADEIAMNLWRDTKTIDDLLIETASAIRQAYVNGKKHRVEIDDLNRRIEALPDKIEKGEA